METISNNSMSDLIYLFLDGEADSTQQSVLFKSLADNPELQSEFQDAVTLNKSLSADSKNLVPSDELTHNLMVKAGFESGAGSSVSGLVSETARNTFITGLIGKIKTSIIPASIGSIITAALLTTGMYLLNIDFHKDGRADISNEGIRRQVKTQNESPVPIVKSNEVQSEIKSHLSTNVVRRNSLPVFAENTQTAPENKEEIVTENKVEPEEIIPVILIPDIQQSDLVEMKEKPELKYKPKDFTQLNVPPAAGFGDLSLPTKLGFVVEVKGINNLGYTDVRKMDESKVFLKNIGLNVFFKLSDNMLIGGGIGNEQMQVYEVVEDAFKNISFLSEPNLTWLSVSGRYIVDKLEYLGSLQPYGELSFGVATKWGPVGKGGIGLYYNPENRFTMGLGLEGTGLYLVKPRDGKYMTFKLALVYSFGYNF